ncbi:unnamed protein product [Heterobilharzia americana]|nr:unnamed protein product [Heterobilharzia americana]
MGFCRPWLSVIFKNKNKLRPLEHTISTQNEPALKMTSFYNNFIQDKCELTTPPVVEARLSMTSDETEEELTAEEISRRKEFKQKRRLVDLEGADGLNLKAVLAHRVSLPGVGGEEEDEDEGKGENVSYQDEQMPGGSVYTGGDESISLPSKSLEQESDSNWSFPDTENF